jgi:hypothetical protein
MNAHIVFKPTKLNIWYPTINGKDAYRDLSKLHGCTFLKANHPVFENQDDASVWAADHGYTFEFGAAPEQERIFTTGKQKIMSPESLAALLADD